MSRFQYLEHASLEILLATTSHHRNYCQYKKTPPHINTERQVTFVFTYRFQTFIDYRHSVLLLLMNLYFSNSTPY